MTKIDRNSNIELLRIVLMVMLLILHFNGQFTPLPDNKETINSGVLPHIQLAVEALTIIVVNTFVLISGYFGIKNIRRKILSLYFICFFYSLIYFIYNVYNHSSIGLGDIIDLFLCFTHTPLWFIKSYVALLLFVPILNCSINNITQKQFKLIIFILTIYNVYMCWLWKAEVNTDGYNVMQFIYLYFIGRYISIYKIKTTKNQGIILYIICSAVVYSMTVLCLYFNAEKHIGLHALAYNNPFIILASISFLMIFLNMDFKNKIVNWIASSSLAVYIFHLYFWNEIKEYVIKMHNELSLEYFIAFNLCMILFLFIASIFIDKIRMFIFSLIQTFSRKLIKYLPNRGGGYFK